jgi:hypothetical protein
VDHIFAISGQVKSGKTREQGRVKCADSLGS